MKKYISAITTASILVGALSSVASATGTASFSLSPASGNHVQNTGFSVAVHENGTEVNTVTAKLTYDASKLTCTSVSGSSTFPSTIQASCANGTVTISDYITPGGSNVNGDAIVGTINFSAVANSGSTSVAFATGSQIASNGVNTWDGNTAGGNYTFSAPVTTPPNDGGHGGGSGNTGTPGGSSTGHSTTSSSTSNSASDNGTVAGTSTDQSNTPAASTNDTKSQSASKSNSSTASTAVQPVKHTHKMAWTAGILVILAVIGTAAYYVSDRARKAMASVMASTKGAYQRVLHGAKA